MVLTLELPIRPRIAAVPATTHPLQAYASRFGALPAWFDELSPGRARSLALGALRQGVPLAAADQLS